VEAKEKNKEKRKKQRAKPFFCNHRPAVDQRRFGSWTVVGRADEWGPDRGPCPVGEFEVRVVRVVRGVQCYSINALNLGCAWRCAGSMLFFRDR
jgi:hypothetical protein